MPVWHEGTKKFQDAGRVETVGIIEEQHPDRARLFMQWKRMGWPIMVDSLDLLQTSAVPMTLLVDEYGVIRAVNPRFKPEEVGEKFLNLTYEKPAALPAAKDTFPDFKALGEATQRDTADAWRAYADALVEWGKPEQLDDAIGAYQKALRLKPEDGDTYFHLGVAYRKRFDSSPRRAGDFQKAVDEWQAALAIDPNQYIWRRRIQQYGPRLDKPYPFYDWVVEARKGIAARGETPAPLSVEPGGAEFSKPLKTFAAANSALEEPDPKGGIHRDNGQFIRVETTVVPDTNAQGTSASVHVAFRPNLGNKAHWNNEVGPLVLWVNPPSGWSADSRYLTAPNPPAPTSQETRRVEFELKGAGKAGSGAVTIPAYALYYVCEDVNGVCMYRRQDVAIKIEPHAGGR